MKKNTEEGKDDGGEEYDSTKVERRNSAFAGGSPGHQPVRLQPRNSSQSPDSGEISNETQEHSGVSKNVEKIKTTSSPKHPSKMASTSQNRRFVPFEKK